MEQLIPTRTELLSKKAHLGLAQQGKDLLKQKQEVLLIEFMNVIKEGIRIESLLARLVAQGQYALTIAEAVDGPVAMKSASLATSGNVRVNISGSQIMGIQLPVVNKVIGASRTLLERGYGITNVSSRIDEAAEKFEKLVDILIDNAHIETRLRRLGEEILKTRRRVNALELYVVPRLFEEIKLIRMILDEREREDLFRLKKVKKIISYRRKVSGVKQHRLFLEDAIPKHMLANLPKINLSSSEYCTIKVISGPLIYIDDLKDVSYGEMVELIPPVGLPRTGQVLEIDNDTAMVQIFEGTGGVDTEKSIIKLKKETPHIDVSMDLLGRTLNGLGKPIDGLPPVLPEDRLEITGLPINPYSRDTSSDFIETGISAIDVMNTLLQGQKLAIFSCAGLPANKIIAQIIKQAKIKDEKNFVVIFAAMGITNQEKTFFMNEFAESGVTNRLISFLNLADDPTVERVITPRCALTVAEYFAFKHNLQVLVILTNMTNYCEALREVSSAREETPGKRGYPSYMHTDLASIYERAGKIRGKKGSITQLIILTMPDDDITHPIPDLTAYTTDVQLVLSRHLHSKGIYPPIDILPTPPRIMNIRSVMKKTRDDHQELVDQIYGAYAHGKDLQKLVSIVGEDSLSALDKRYLELAKQFEDQFINQKGGFIDIFDSIESGWNILNVLPPENVHHLKRTFINKPLKKIEDEEKLLKSA
ncbi:V-type ATP synthase subunit B [Candidatus Poribacteria bacterium]|nr:V-type ATP synthase subunit B [Candidatus Poribacteria bacterium]